MTRKSRKRNQRKSRRRTEVAATAANPAAAAAHPPRMNQWSWIWLVVGAIMGGVHGGRTASKLSKADENFGNFADGVVAVMIWWYTLCFMAFLCVITLIVFLVKRGPNGSGQYSLYMTLLLSAYCIFSWSLFKIVETTNRKEKKIEVKKT